jgi:FMN phosphatase YigB (HAD superfamily)
MIPGIRHIIFDLGGVLLNIDYALTEKAFIDLGVTNFHELYSQAAQTELFDKWETGQVTEDEFVTAIQGMASIPLTAGQIKTAWNAMLLDFPLRRLQILQQLHLYYDLVLLSNTNALHEQAFNKILMDSRSMNIAAFFDKVYFSHKIGMRKPSVEIFTRILDENGFLPEHTLFLDDSIQHIYGARQAGITAIHMEKGMTMEDSIFLPKNK